MLARAPARAGRPERGSPRPSLPHLRRVSRAPPYSGLLSAAAASLPSAPVFRLASTADISAPPSAEARPRVPQAPLDALLPDPRLISMLRAPSLPPTSVAALSILRPERLLCLNSPPS